MINSQAYLLGNLLGTGLYLRREGHRIAAAHESVNGEKRGRMFIVFILIMTTILPMKVRVMSMFVSIIIVIKI